VPVGLPSDLLQRRPDVQRAERELAAATARIGVAKADLFPKFSLTGIAGLQSISANNWFDYASRYWSAGPTVQWELFEAGRIRANVRVQNARQEQALDAYQQTVLTALEDAENALNAYAREQVRRESLSQSVQANQQALDLSTQLYKSGLADFLHVLDSERSLYAAQDALVQSDQAVSLNLVQLYKALGGGWEKKPRCHWKPETHERLKLCFFTFKTIYVQVRASFWGLSRSVDRLAKTPLFGPHVPHAERAMEKFSAVFHGLVQAVERVKKEFKLEEPIETELRQRQKTGLKDDPKLKDRGQIRLAKPVGWLPAKELCDLVVPHLEFIKAIGAVDESKLTGAQKARLAQIKKQLRRETNALLRL
jgi:hypothetical protein